MKSISFFQVVFIFIILVAAPLQAWSQAWSNWWTVLALGNEKVMVRYQLLSCNEGGISGIRDNPMVQIKHSFRYQRSISVTLEGVQCSGNVTEGAFHDKLYPNEDATDGGNWNTWKKINQLVKVEMRWDEGEDYHVMVCEGNPYRCEEKINGKTLAEIQAQEAKKKADDEAKLKKEEDDKAEAARQKQAETMRQDSIRAVAANEAKIARDNFVADSTAQANALAEQAHKEKMARKAAKDEQDRKDAEKAAEDKRIYVQNQVLYLSAKSEATRANYRNELNSFESLLSKYISEPIGEKGELFEWEKTGISQQKREQASKIVEESPLDTDDFEAKYEEEISTNPFWRTLEFIAFLRLHFAQHASAKKVYTHDKNTSSLPDTYSSITTLPCSISKSSTPEDEMNMDRDLVLQYINSNVISLTTIKINSITPEF